MRAAVYCGTRNLYQHMVTAAKSLMIHSNVEKIYFLIQDDVFPYQLPQIFECINVSNQQYFRKDGPNYKSKFTYMALIRAALTKIFPNLNTILSLDVDTIVNENISDLWDIDLTNYYIAGAIEPKKSTENYMYINAGVMLINLKKLREDKKDDEIINILNTNHFTFDIQDAYNKQCQTKIYELSPEYNVNSFTKFKQIQCQKIIHFAAMKLEKWIKYPLISQYKNTKFDNIFRNVQRKVKIDIIIPTYKDKVGLRNTLKSINRQLLNYYTVSVVDDASNEDYTDIINDFPFINLYKLSKNSGPGVARQYLLERTINPYILFLDSGDSFMDNDIQINMIKTIKKHPQIILFSWSYYNPQINGVAKDVHNNLHGRIYYRNILNKYHLTFSQKGSYVNQDIGFNRTLRILLTQYNNIYIYFHSLSPLINRDCNQNSLTRKENHAFSYRDQNLGLAYNEQHLFQILELNNINEQKKQIEADQIIISMYKTIYKTAQQRPQFLQNAWSGAKYFYDHIYYKYVDTPSIFRNNAIGLFLKKRNPQWQKKIPINVNRFLKDIAIYSEVPDYYK